jgi:hypothetical protein
MANTNYDKFREFLLFNALNSADVRCLLIDKDVYTFNAAHEFLSSVPVGARVAMTASLTGKTFTNGIFKTANTLFPSAAGAVSEAYIVYIHTGTDSTSRIIQFIDTATGLAITPNGADISLTFHATGIMEI